MELGNPEKVGWEVFDFAFFVVFGEFLFVVVETGGETAFGILVHLTGADLELDDFFVGGNHGCMEGLVTVLLRDGDVIFYSTVHRGIEGVEKTHCEVAGGDVGDDNAEGGDVVNLAHILVVLGEFFVEGIDGLDATGNLGGDFFFPQEGGDLTSDLFKVFFGGFVGFFDKVF